MNELPRQRAFLLQLAITANPDSDDISGRIEQVQTGYACRFNNRSELFAFLSRTLCAQQDDKHKPKMRTES